MSNTKDEDQDGGHDGFSVMIMVPLPGRHHGAPQGHAVPARWRKRLQPTGRVAVSRGAIRTRRARTDRRCGLAAGRQQEGAAFGGVILEGQAGGGQVNGCPAPTLHPADIPPFC